MRRLLVRLLFHLLDTVNYKDIDDERIFKWLVDQYKNRGFRSYFEKRDLELLKTIGSGLDREKYLMYLGQRVELMRLLQSVKRAYMKNEEKPKKVGK